MSIKKIKIGGHLFKIEKRKIHHDNLAECDYNKTTITISNEIEDHSLQCSSLLHEIIHACNSTFGSEHMDHCLLDSLSEQLYQVLSDNDLLNKNKLKELLK